MNLDIHETDILIINESMIITILNFIRLYVVFKHYFIRDT